MNTYIIIGIGFGLLLALIFIRVIFRKEKSYEPKKYSDLYSLMGNEKLNIVVSELLKRQKKIEAIKYVRETGKVSLIEAKDFVEKIELNMSSGNIKFNDANENVYAEADNDAELNSKVKPLIESGNKILAIKLVSKTHNMGLAEAKDHVEKIEKMMKEGRI